ncbi:hypothetical protein GGR55DRAFT_541719 [Xylaria sp. FL0064]|nr:hypothetical protein GGR55DRAFT_541719 [Xylaria sp. FL0064]
MPSSSLALAACPRISLPRRSWSRFSRQKRSTSCAPSTALGMTSAWAPESALRVYVECPKHLCLEAARVMLEFIEQALGIVEQLSPEEVEEYRKACMKSSDTKIKTLDEYQSWAWGSISTRTQAPCRRTAKSHKGATGRPGPADAPLVPRGHPALALHRGFAKKRETAEGNSAYVELFPESRNVAFVTDVADFPDLSAPEEAEESPEDFLVKSGDFADKSIVIRYNAVSIVSRPWTLAPGPDNVVTKATKGANPIQIHSFRCCLFFF